MPIQSLTPDARNLLSMMSYGSYSASRDILKHRVWDQWLLPAARANHTFFSQPIGSTWGAGVKAIGETNLYDTGKLPNGQIMVVQRMGVLGITNGGVAATNGDLLVEGFMNVLDSSVFEIKIQGREWDYQIHGTQFTPNFKALGNTGATNINYRVGDYIASGWSKLDPTPIVIDQLVGFSVELTLNNPIAAIVTKIDASLTALNTAGATLMVVLEGVLSRAK